MKEMPQVHDIPKYTCIKLTLIVRGFKWDGNTTSSAKPVICIFSTGTIMEKLE